MTLAARYELITPSQKRIDMNAFMREVIEAAREGQRLFFAPLRGAIEAVRREMAHLADGSQREPESPRSRATTSD